VANILYTGVVSEWVSEKSSGGILLALYGLLNFMPIAKYIHIRPHHINIAHMLNSGYTTMLADLWNMQDSDLLLGLCTV